MSATLLSIDAMATILGALEYVDQEVRESYERELRKFSWNRNKEEMVACQRTLARTAKARKEMGR